MAVPDFQSLMLPAVKALANHQETTVAELRERIASAEGLTPEDIRESMPSGSQPKFTNRVSWVLVYLGIAGITEKTQRGVYRLTAEGKRLLADPPPHIDMEYLKKYPAYVAWRSGKGVSPSNEDAVTTHSAEPMDTPEEALQRANQQLRSALEADMLQRVRNATSGFLEKVAVKLLITMGYGGGDASKGYVTGRSGDGGIDGYIFEDALGLERIHLQTKKYEDKKSVGPSDLRDFAGAIDAAGANKGVFVTTSSFTQSAKEFVEKSPKRIALIDGEELAQLMVQHGVGARERSHYKVMQIDDDYFDENL